MKESLKFIYAPLLIVLFSIFLSCAYESRIIKDGEKREDYYIIWVHSDIQPIDESGRGYYEKAIMDVKDNISAPDMAIVAGDIVQGGLRVESDFKWFLKVREGAGVDEWYEIAGNHEWSPIDFYKKYIRSTLNYSISKGNLLILMISNEARGRQTFISDETFQWWKEMVQNNQNKIIITVTHGALEGSGLTAGRIDRLRIIDSQRFTEVLKKFRVDIWISGHSHLPGWLPGTLVTNRELGGTTFVDAGAIRKDFMTSIESRLLFFKEGSRNAVIRKRNHAKAEYMSQEYKVQLSFPFTR